MATVEVFLDTARYDLRDYQEGLEFDDEELLVYVNRMKSALDSMLISLNSSYVQDSSDLTLLIATNSINARTNLNSGNWDSIREVWIGSNRLEKISADLMFYKRKFISGTGEPQFWTPRLDHILFDQTADQQYTVNVSYNKKTATLSLSSSMPYSDVFNEAFRELLIMHAKAKKEGVMAPTEQAYQALFRQVAFQNQIRTDRKEKYYHLGF